jgi:hypothetical protein
MYSILRPSLIYKDISRDITENDEDYDADEWTYSDKTVFRGGLDTSYAKYGLDVYSLYDDELNRIGLAEHESDNHATFRALWFRDTPFGTLFQEDWTAGDSVFNLLSPEAYQDCSDTNILLKAHNRLVTMKYLTDGLPSIYECHCGKSFLPMCSAVKKTVVITNPIFVDDLFVMYQPPSESRVWIRLEQLHVASGQVQAPQEQTPLPEHLPPVEPPVEPPEGSPQ